MALRTFNQKDESPLHKVMIEHSLHSVFICDIHTVRFPLDCSRAGVCPCKLFRVRCRPHSEGCDCSIKLFLLSFWAQRYIFINKFIHQPSKLSTITIEKEKRYDLMVTKKRKLAIRGGQAIMGHQLEMIN